MIQAALPKVPGTNSGPAWASFASIPAGLQRRLAQTPSRGEQ